MFYCTACFVCYIYICVFEYVFNGFYFTSYICKCSSFLFVFLRFLVFVLNVLFWFCENLLMFLLVVFIIPNSVPFACFEIGCECNLFIRQLVLASLCPFGWHELL